MSVERKEWTIHFKGNVPTQRTRKSKMTFSLNPLLPHPVRISLQNGNKGREQYHYFGIDTILKFLQSTKQAIELLDKDKPCREIFRMHRINLQIRINEYKYPGNEETRRYYIQELTFTGPQGGYTSAVSVHMSIEDLCLLQANLEDIILELKPPQGKPKESKYQKKQREREEEDLLSFLDV